MPERINVYIGEKPFYAYEQAAMRALTQTGQVFILARGQKIPRAAAVAHRMEKGYIGVHIASEVTYIEELPDDRRGAVGGNQRNSEEAGESIVNSVEDAEEARAAGPRMRPVVVYEARLILQKEEKQEVKA